MASVLTMRCHACNVRIKTQLELFGQVRPCPRCGQAVRVRLQPPEDSGPVLVRDQHEIQTTVIPALALNASS